MSKMVEKRGLMSPDPVAMAQAVKFFWRGRAKASAAQKHKGVPDRGARSAVTGGKNMDGVAALISDLIKSNGGDGIEVCRNQPLLTLPGFFRPTKNWDIVAMRDGKLVVAIELKSQVGPSFGNNCNNRAEEAIGVAQDFWTAYRDGAFGECQPPFLGWLMLVEDCPASRKPISCDTPHFPVFPEFENASYLDRYDILARKLIQEKLYTSAAVMVSPSSARTTGAFVRMSELTDMNAFITRLACHCRA